MIFHRGKVICGIVSLSQSIVVKRLGKKLSEYCAVYRSRIVSAMKIRQKTNNLTLREVELLISYAPPSNSSLFTNETKRFDRQSPTLDVSESRLEHSRLVINLLEQATKIRFQIAAFNDVLIKSVLPKCESFYETEQFHRFPSNDFNRTHLYRTFHYEVKQKSNECVRCFREQLTEDDLNVSFAR